MVSFQKARGTRVVWGKSSVEDPDPDADPVFFESPGPGKKPVPDPKPLSTKSPCNSILFIIYYCLNYSFGKNII